MMRLFAALTLVVGLNSAPAVSAEITVFAAASLKTALDQIAANWQARTFHTVVISYGSSAALAKQIEQGAPADLFLSAAVNWMDVLDDAGLLRADTRRDLLGNTLVLVASGAVAPVKIAPGMDLAGMLAGGKLSMGLVDSVPAGQYGKAALETLGLWATVEASVAQSENVRVALALVTLGEAPYGVVYGSDAIAEDKVSLVGTFPADSHPPIIYPAAVIADSKVPEAVDFLTHLSSPEAGAVFSAQGFSLLK